MNETTKELLERTFLFGVKVMKFLASLPENHIYNVTKRQLARSATSIGANYEEAQAAQSRKDFIYKIAISAKETRESHYWLRLLKKVYDQDKLVSRFDEFILEAAELRKIFTSIKKTSQEKSAKT